MAEAEHWIGGAIEHGGYLHRALGIPEGEKIPLDRIRDAAKSDNEHLKRAANLALTLHDINKRHQHGGIIG